MKIAAISFKVSCFARCLPNYLRFQAKAIKTQSTFQFLRHLFRPTNVSNRLWKTYEKLRELGKISSKKRRKFCTILIFFSKCQSLHHSSPFSSQKKNFYECNFLENIFPILIIFICFGRKCIFFCVFIIKLKVFYFFIEKINNFDKIKEKLLNLFKRNELRISI